MTIKEGKRYDGGGKKMLVNILIYAVIAIVALRIAFAIPNTLTLQGKLTNAAGGSLSGSYTMVFRIYDIPGFSYFNVSNQTGGDNTAISNITYINYTNILWEDNRTVTTDANGIYDVILSNLSALNFSDQYYLGIMVMGDNESVPRINLSSTPYAFRANISEQLNRKNRYEVSALNITGNLTLGTDSADVLSVTTERINISGGNINAAGNLTIGERITFSLGLIIDNLVNGFLRVSGKLNVTGNVSIGQDTLFVDNTSRRVGIGTTAPINLLTIAGDVSAFGSLNATFINATQIRQNGNLVQTVESAFNLGNVSNYTQYIQGSDFNIGNISNYTQYIRSSDFNIGNISNYTQYAKSSDFNLGNISNNTLVKGDNATLALWNKSGSNIFNREFGGNVGIGKTNPNYKLDVAGTINASGLLLTNGTFSIGTGGRIGIGTSEPSSAFVVVGNASFNRSTGGTSINFDTTNNAILFNGENGSLYQPVYGTDDGLVLYLPFSENAINVSNKTYDRSPYGNDGLLVNMNIGNATNGTGWANGKYGYGMSFDGSNDYVSVSDVTGILAPSSLTAEVWVKFNALSTGAILSKKDTTFSQSNGWQIRLDSPTSVAFRGSSNVADQSVNFNFVVDVWYHIVVTVIGRTDIIYVNGVVKGSTTDYIDAIVSNTDSLRVGKYSDDYPGWLNGTIDEVKIYNRALAPEEIRTHYLRGKGFGASGAITADKFRVVNTTGGRVLEVNQSGFAVHTSGQERLKIDSSGNVGIGTTGPGFLLELEGSQPYIYQDSSGDALFLPR